MIALVSATLLVASPPADAPSTVAPTEAASDAEPATASLARTLFERGLLAYEAGDYAAATTHWTSAYELMASDPALAKPRRVLAFDLGQAHMRAYDASGDRSRLGHARPLLEDYVAWVDRPGHTMSDDEREDRARATEMLARIDILEGAPPSPRVTPTSSSPALVDRPPAASPRRNGTGLIVGGAVSLAGSVTMAVAAGVFSARNREAEEDFLVAQADLDRDPNDSEAANRRDRAEFEGTQGNAGLIATATLSAVLGAGGIAMIATGAWMRRRARNVAAAPSLAPGFAGATLRVRF